MTDRFVTVPDSLELPAAVKVPVARLVGPTGAAATPADLGAATAEQGEKADASDVAALTLMAPLALTVPAGFPAGQVYRVTLTQDGTGGHTVTYDGQPVAVDTAAGAVTTVELHPVGTGYVVRYPAPTAASRAGMDLVSAPDVSAQRRLLGSARDTGALAHLDLARARAAHAANHLTIPTYDGSGQAVHPDVLVLDEPWNKYRYWMAMTPYPNSVDTWENPSILASHDGLTWVVPAGLTNPIDSPSSGFLPDPCLVMDGGTMWCIYAGSKAKWSTDGVTWSARQTITFTNAAGGSKLSPSVIKEDGAFHYWCVDSLSSPNALYRGTGTSPAAYGDLTACTLVGGPVGRDLWHVSVRAIRGGYVGAFVYVDMDVSGRNAVLHLATSPDGAIWNVGIEPLLAPDPSIPWVGASIYRACIVPTDGAGGIWGRLWYSAYSLTHGWHIGYTPLRSSGPESLPELIRSDAVALHAQPIVVRGDSRNVLPDADLLRPAAGNLVPHGWANNLVGASGHAWYPDDESWSVICASTSSRAINRILTEGIALIEGDAWTFSAEVRSDSSGNGKQLVQIGFQDSGGALIGPYAYGYTTTATWRRVYAKALVPAGAAKISLLIVNTGTTADPTRYWWRRAQLEKSATPTAWTPGPSTTIRLGAAASVEPVVKVCGPLTAAGSPVLMSITKEGAVALAKYTTALRPAAAVVGEGAVIYDDTLNLPIFSDGTSWKNLAGTVV